MYRALRHDIDASGFAPGRLVCMSKVRIGTKTYEDQLASLSGAQLRDVIETAEPHRSAASPRERGAYSPSRPIAIEVKQIGGETRRLVVKPVDLTEDGFGCLVGLYLYSGQECTVHLVTTDGEHFTASGMTKNCVFLGSRAHFLEIKFHRAVDMDLFFPTARAPVEPEAGGVRLIARLLERIEGRLDHPLRDDFVTILRSEASRLAQLPDEAMLTEHELQTPDRVAVLSYNGNFLAVNPAWLLFAVETGYEGRAFQSQNYLDVLEAHRESCQTVPAILDAVQATIGGVSRECRYAYHCHNEGGDPSYFLVRHTADKRMHRRVIVVTHMRIDADSVSAVADAA